jgi:hypothetical protein
MDTLRTSARGALLLALGLLVWTNAGCRHGKAKSPARSSLPISETQAAPAKSVSRPTEDPAEKRLQDQITSMQEQIGPLTERTEAMARFHGAAMGPKWVEKVQAARANASRPSERIRYLEATKALLARRLEALRAELKVYQEFESSDPAIRRP